VGVDIFVEVDRGFEELDVWMKGRWRKADWELRSRKTPWPIEPMGTEDSRFLEDFDNAHTRNSKECT
jgi:hypothetical protein